MYRLSPAKRAEVYVTLNYTTAIVAFLVTCFAYAVFKYPMTYSSPGLLLCACP